MKNLLLTLGFILSLTLANAQDKIYMTNNSVVEAKIIEVGVTEIKYKKFNNPTGPDYVVPKSSIAVIIFENGTHEVISGAKNEVDLNEEIDNSEIAILPYYKTGKNYIGINYFDLVYKNVNINYSRFLCGMNFNVGLSASFGMSRSTNNSGFLDMDKDYFHGIASFNYFPSGVNKVSFFTGVSILSGYGKDYTYYYYEPSTLVEKFYYGVYVNNGILFSLNKHFNMRTQLNLGMVDRDMNGQFQVHAMFEIGAGIRF